MASSRYAAKSRRRKTPPRRSLRVRLSASRRAFRALRAAPLVLQLVALAIVSIGAWAATNWVYHAVHKPTELLFPVSRTFSKTPSETWREYEPYFRKYATPVIAPELLAALAQVESEGNPLAQTYWRWRPAMHPFEVYGPASSAVGMYQITDATFARSKRQCLDESEDNLSVPGSCWFDGLYGRLAPGRAVQFTAQNLDRSVVTALRRQRIATATLQLKQDLAAVIHLCGAGAGETYARRGFRLTPGQRCGDHDVRSYLGRVNGMKSLFARLASDS